MVLPNFRDKPSFQLLLKTLKSLEVKPRSWDDDSAKSLVDRPILSESTVQEFLLGVFKTDFSWFEDTEDEDLGIVTAQEQIDEIVDMASRRLAERCGRSARGQDTRTFRLEVPQHCANDFETQQSTANIELQIREPPLTGDNLGLKTWGSAWTMVQLLPQIGLQPALQRLIDQPRFSKSRVGLEGPELQVLELGAGTGLVGMAAAALWGVNVVLTDLPAIHENLRYNIDINMPAISRVSNGHACAEILDWSDHENALHGWSSKEFEVILAVDPLYDDDHPQLLADTIKQFAKRGKVTVVLTAVPFRDKTTQLLCLELERLMEGNGFKSDYKGENICRDDWESANAREVMVSWALWSGRDADR
ncbi:uncharacterized protein LY89DRAFT_15269 [Mollisia scopiformis]|uniref:Uncharacterized protein n=1 Tax=Mollisia scopiformis TaxID=149040 RepID=A0A194XVG1_MOLSC|nr:uncharacterized protein LY89DRAFT_15269 [Mollisia scopiformis]KUJ24213.1 hypothetical protein LY89DRAFT_15269 [Mollisia scopiformis]